MSDGDALNLVLLVFRVAIGATFVMHGYNKVKNGLAGTAGWFGSMGMRAPMLQARAAAVTEIGSGALLVAGLLTPLAGAGVVGTMLVAWVIAHRNNGFFIFLPGGGWEFVMVLLFVGITLGTIGPGEWSLDEAFGLRDDLFGATGLYLSAGLGLVGGAALLASCWRPPAATAEN
ncbi:MAG TPA: DoxX family protein [Ilumatobacter sp.]|nr:DoxX family protein [Ilumatobacter sp.]